ncbi:NAD(P)H-hydrate dehydratase [Cypionkella sp.]|uniref:NAD(P)H-hydrate dehydratase n=1 Tax=Cypionkella sp. TaxID=2811411 RepID=UPI00260BBF01|nr:NAD(P)H-hydrate dehydratase [Cypionkella sp.]MDB5665306.1 yjeF, hydroxyethylthiazole kinaserelated protein/yjeF [Cypionkella sp.]
MSELLTAAQMKAIEATAIASGAVTGLELMERAGAGVVAAVLEEWPELAVSPQRAVVLCGPGNNGGDGFVVARLLAGRGWDVRVLAASAPDKMPPDASASALKWRAIGSVERLTEQNLRSGTSNDLYVDAIFGAGLSRPPEGEIADILTHIGGRNGDNAYYTPRLVAVDVPSVLCLDSGRSMLSADGYLPRARLTVTFDSLKVGHVIAGGPELCGRIAVVDIGVEPWRNMERPRRTSVGWSGIWKRARLGLVGPVQRGQIFATLRPGAIQCESLGKSGWVEPQNTHKYSFGHALIVSGDHGHAGAARMAARAALRIGAGLVTVASPLAAMAENAARLDAVMLKLLADAAGLAEVLADARINALCLGPGMGLDAAAAELVRIALETSRLRLKAGAARGLRLVLDADALTLIARDAGLFGLLHEGCVLTPHAGEFARLFPDIAAKLAAPAVTGPAYSKVDATREAAARAGCVVLYKGADTVIAAPDGRCSINAAVYERSAPWLATAGSGDVLAGFITGLLARGFELMQAAETAAWLHVECARSFGPGLIAEDLAEELPKVFRALGV